MTTFLCIGDPHFQVSNIPEVDLFLEKIIILANQKKPDIIIILGDTLHTHERLHTVALNKAYEFINSMRQITKTYVLVGNHDMCNTQNFLSENHWLNAMKEWHNTVIVDKALMEMINGKKFVFLPYVFPGRFIEALDTLEEKWDDAFCIFAHQEFSGCKMGAIVSVEGDKWPLENPYVVSGHIHSRQTPQKNIYYPGSAMQHAFGESEKNVIAFLTFQSKKYELEEIDLCLPRKKIVYMDVEDVDTYTAPQTDDKIKVTLSGNYDQFKALKKTKKYKQLVDQGVKVIFKPKKIKKDGNPKHTDETDFKTILGSIITEQKDPYLFQAYELIINGKKMDIDDIIFL